MNPVVHLELHTADLPEARATYGQLCGWRAEAVQTQSGPYMALGLGERFGGGIVECGVRRPTWLPYVQVNEIQAAAARAREFGASVLARAQGGPSRLAHGRVNARGRRDSLLAAKGLGTVNERALLETARGGDEDAFSRLVAPHRAELHAHCYRMLGSVHDAEDALQEALLRAWRGLESFAGRSSLRSWLYRIATNACLRAIERRPQRVLPIDYRTTGRPSR